MSNNRSDIEALSEALQVLTATTQTMEEAHRRLHQRIHELDRELAVTTEYLSSLLESITDGVIAVDLDGRITSFNRAASSILGYTSAELVGRDFREVFGRDFDAPRLPEEQVLQTRSGRVAPVSERDSWISDKQGRRIGKVKTFQDLTELSALREQMRQMDRLAAIGEMAATVAHEIRNPLGGIRGFAAFLAQDTPEEDPRRRLIDKIVVGAESLERVLSGLLEYTRPVHLERRPVNCREVVVGALTFLEYDRDRVRLDMQVGDDARMLADAHKLRQVMLNVLLNAVQSIEGEGQVSVACELEDRQVRLHVRDTGCGMKQEDLKRVFSPFYTTKEKGTGLGLAISQKIMEAHGGSIMASSTPGEGSEITLIVPRAE